jgi:hypothetical protein
MRYHTDCPHFTHRNGVALEPHHPSWTRGFVGTTMLSCLLQKGKDLLDAKYGVHLIHNKHQRRTCDPGTYLAQNGPPRGVMVLPPSPDDRSCLPSLHHSSEHPEETEAQGGWDLINIRTSTTPTVTWSYASRLHKDVGHRTPELRVQAIFLPY